MDGSAASYSNYQLGNGQNSFVLTQRQVNRIAHVSRSRRSISHLLGATQVYGSESQTGECDFAETLASFGASNVSSETAGSDDYLKNLITDNEVAQIRSEKESLISELLSLYVFEDTAKVRSFLEDHPSTPHILLEAFPFLKKSFGDDAILQLQIPSDEDVPLTIYAVAIWNGTLEDARAALKNFDDTWWTANGRMAAGKVVMDYQLV